MRHFRSRACVWQNVPFVAANSNKTLWNPEAARRIIASSLPTFFIHDRDR